MGYDNFPLTTIEEKKQVLARATEKDWILFFEHDPFGPAARVEAGPRGFKAGAREIF